VPDTGLLGAGTLDVEEAATQIQACKRAMSHPLVFQNGRVIQFGVAATHCYNLLLTIDWQVKDILHMYPFFGNIATYLSVGVGMKSVEGIYDCIDYRMQKIGMEGNNVEIAQSLLDRFPLIFGNKVCEMEDAVSFEGR
jgi:hypothetical protein